MVQISASYPFQFCVKAAISLIVVHDIWPDVFSQVYLVCAVFKYMYVYVCNRSYVKDVHIT